VTPPPPRTRSHLVAFSIAFAIAAVCVAAGLSGSIRLEQNYVHALAPEFPPCKLQGVVLQRLAFEQPDLLPFYGSSELAKPMANNPNEFFADYPTGFAVFPVGKPGATSLTAAQKLGGVGKTLRGKKVAISLSPGWFFTEVFDPKYYEGNFSESQVMQLVYGGELSWELRRDMARRMIEYPRTYETRAMLDFSLHCLASDKKWDHLLFHVSQPLGNLNRAICLAQDHLEASIYIMEQYGTLKSRPRLLRRVQWNDVLKRAVRFSNKNAVQTKRNEVVRRHLPRASRDIPFRNTLAKAKEWTDVELMLRVLKELGAKPLIMSMPVEDIRLEVYGISPETRTAYNERLVGLTAKYQFPLVDFRQYQKDPSFLVDFLDHLSASGWLYYNKALDDFYHERLPQVN
jgi:D-alanine transfer protein